MRNFLLIISFVLINNGLWGSEIKDVCGDNRTTYKKLNDSVWRVESYFQNRPVFMGQCQRPDTTIHFNYSEEPEFYDPKAFVGLCEFYDLNGRLTKRVRFEK